MADSQTTPHHRAINLAGRRFVMLVAQEPARRPNGVLAWRCRCDCGGESIVRTAALRNGAIQSCGCLKHEPAWNRAHGCEPRRLYRKWRNILARCGDPRNRSYPDYGGRGITVCAEWTRYETFRDWALANGWRPELWIDRIDNDGPYHPDNCRFGTPKENLNNNRRNRHLTWQGRTLTVSQWADELGVDQGSLGLRLWRGWSLERTFTQPFRKVSRRSPR